MSMTLQSSYNDSPSGPSAGSLDGGPAVKSSYKQADTVSIPFGFPIAFKPSPTTDQDVYVPAASTDKIAGFLFRSDAYSRSWTDENGTHGELDSTGVRPGFMINGARKGRIRVPCHTGCVPGDRLFVAYNNTGATYTAAGQLGNVAEAGHAIDCSNQGQWTSTAAADGLAWLEFDFVNK